jgi:hypothetical protein
VPSLRAKPMRRTMPTLSYTVIEHLPKWCLMQVPAAAGREAEPLGRRYSWNNFEN